MAVNPVIGGKGLGIGHSGDVESDPQDILVKQHPQLRGLTGALVLVQDGKKCPHPLHIDHDSAAAGELPGIAPFAAFDLLKYLELRLQCLDVLRRSAGLFRLFLSAQQHTLRRGEGASVDGRLEILRNESVGEQADVPEVRLEQLADDMGGAAVGLADILALCHHLGDEFLESSVPLLHIPGEGDNLGIVNIVTDAIDLLKSRADLLQVLPGRPDDVPDQRLPDAPLQLLPGIACQLDCQDVLHDLKVS